MGGKVSIINVNEKNVAETGFFCYMSKRQTEGYQRKLRWLRSRFAEGMKIKLITKGARGFIEYIPGEFAWRPVNAPGYMLIHCIWVSGMSKGKGIARLLLNECIRDAKKARMLGVAMATSEGNWLAGKEFLEKYGFYSVDNAYPSFELLVRKFRNGLSPSFTGDWENKMMRLGSGLTIVRSDQCPYIEASVAVMRQAAKELEIETRVIELRSPQEVRELAPSPYGVFNVVYESRLLSYHPLGRESFLRRLNELRNQPTLRET